jgi:FtsP/CotA-like multicopper oxidase with cupredoxin domain
MQVVVSVCLLMLFYLCLVTAVKKYNWTVRYIKHNPDGFFRTMIAIKDNGQYYFPGPLLRANKDEWVEVILHNDLPTEAVTCHWHGMHQAGTPWMDGVQQITQFPVLPAHSFNYTFKVDKVGTHWYHSHTGGQYTDGLFGPMIIDDPDDPYRNISNEHIMIINEWYHKNVVDTFDIFTEHYPIGPGYNPFADFVSGLFNGKGRFDCDTENLGSDVCTPGAPRENFNVRLNQTYRFRIIAAGSQFIYILSIDNHNLTIIAIDGIYVEPYTVQQIYIDIGQRYDVLIEMNQPVNNYWIRAVTENNRQRRFKEFNAVLHYVGASNTNDPTSTYDKPTTILSDSSPLVPSQHNQVVNPYMSLKPPNFTVIKVFNLSCHEPMIDHCWINNHQYRLPKYPTLLSMFYHDESITQNNYTHIVDLNIGDRVMIIVNNFVNISHPLHLHGHDFYILGNGKDNPSGDLIQFDPFKHETLLNRINPPIRDTAKLPQRSWLVIGFTANNPGSWLFHCHIAFDMEAGMGLIFNINHGTIPSPPPSYPIIDKYKTFASSCGLKLDFVKLMTLFVCCSVHCMYFLKA